MTGIWAGELEVTAVYKGVALVWEKNRVKSCFGSGWWLNEKPWLNEESWKN